MDDQRHSPGFLADLGQQFLEKEEQAHSKSYMAGISLKRTPIGFDFHQVAVPQNVNPVQYRPPNFSFKPSFLSSRTRESDLDDYLSFIEAYFREKTPDYFEQVSREQTFAKALRFLHQYGYNYTQAKFFVLFPYYLTYNRLNQHQPLTLSEQEMRHKIETHLSALKNTKERDLYRWVSNLEDAIASRIQLSRLNAEIEAGKANKFDLPEHIKEMIEKSVRAGKQLKRTLNAKYSLAKLEQKAKELKEYKIITNELIQFEETVARCFSWQTRQKQFELQYFEYHGNQPFMRPIDAAAKIQFKTLQALYNEFSNLPLIYDSFQQTSGLIYEQAVNLQLRLPALKPNKTRTSQSNPLAVKISICDIRTILQQIEDCPVQHEDFMMFEKSILEELEYMQRISMSLEDQKFEKSLKFLNSSLSRANDAPFVHGVQAKLTNKIEYYELIDKLRKDMHNPTKVDQVKEWFKRLKEKGFQNAQHAKLEIKLNACLDWFQSHHIITNSEFRKMDLTVVQLVTTANQIQQEMVSFNKFENQFSSALREVITAEPITSKCTELIALTNNEIAKTRNLLAQQATRITEMINRLQVQIRRGIAFSEFRTLLIKTHSCLILLAKMQYLLCMNDEKPPNGTSYFLSYKDCLTILNYQKENNRHNEADMQSKEYGRQILTQIKAINFDNSIVECQMFQRFIYQGEQWHQQALALIEEFRLTENTTKIKLLKEKPKHCLYSKQIQQKISRIDIALKWRDKIGKKLIEPHQGCFDTDDVEFISHLQKDMSTFQRLQHPSSVTREQSLAYLSEHSDTIRSILRKIANFSIDNVCRISEINKFIKEIDRQVQKSKLDDKVIERQRKLMLHEVQLSEEWRERYLALKRLEKKKMRRTDEQQSSLPQMQSFEMVSQQHMTSVPSYSSFTGISLINSEASGLISSQAMGRGVLQQAYQPLIQKQCTNGGYTSDGNRKRFYFVNMDFGWYFKLCLYIVEYYNGLQLKFPTEQFGKLRQTLIDVSSIMWKWKSFEIHANAYHSKYLEQLESHGSTKPRLGRIGSLKLHKAEPEASESTVRAIRQYSPAVYDQLSALEAEASRLPIFFLQMQLLLKKTSYIKSWRSLAQSVLRSTPIYSMELKVRNQEELLLLLENKKKQIEAEEKRLSSQKATVEDQPTKRKRKNNPYYHNNIMALTIDDSLFIKTKKRRKGSNPDSDYKSTAVNTLRKRTQKEHEQNKETIRAVLSGQVNTEHFGNDDERKCYCICRQDVTNQNSLMIQCEQRCQQWFHIQCVGMRKHQTKEVAKYICVGCQSLYGLEAIGEFIWNNQSKISQAWFNEIVAEGIELGIQVPELPKIQTVAQKLSEWKQQVSQLLYQICKENLKTLMSYEKTAYSLYLQSLWLPTYQPESMLMKKIVLACRDDLDAE